MFFRAYQSSNYFGISIRWEKVGLKVSFCFEGHYKIDQHAANAQCKNWIEKVCDVEKTKLIFCVT